MNPARLFTIVSLGFGLALIALTPPFCTPDEPAHLYRAWSTSKGTFVIRGGAAVPRTLVESARTMLRMTRGAETAPVTWRALRALARTPLRADDAVFIATVPDAAREPLAYTAPNYTPIGYVATAPAVALGALAGLAPILLVYAARVANLLVATAIIGWAISIAPFGRWTLTLIALTPMAVFMRGALSIDALTMAFAIALFVAILRAKPGAVIVMSFLLCAIKPGYALMPLLALAVPKLRARRGAMIAMFVAIIAGIAMTIAFARDASVTTDASSRGIGVLHQPVGYATALAGEARRDAKLLVVELVADFGWLDAPAPFAFALLWLCGVIAMALIDGRWLLSARARVWSLLLFAAQVAALFTLIHLSTPGDRFLTGLQGRYFLPTLPLAFLPLAATASIEAVKKRGAVFLIAIAIVQSLWVVTTRYWI